jgi:putative transcriptional regulator
MHGLSHLCDYHWRMIRFRLQDRLSDLGFRLQRRITLDEVAAATGIHRTTLSRMNKPTGANVTTDNLDRLCHYLGCTLNELVEYVPSEPPEPRKKSSKSEPVASGDKGH